MMSFMKESGVVVVGKAERGVAEVWEVLVLAEVVLEGGGGLLEESSSSSERSRMKRSPRWDDIVAVGEVL